MNEGLVYIGKIVEITLIDGADFIVSAKAVCGKGGIWKGIIRKNDFQLGSPCIVYLPDAQIPPNEEMKFMESSAWRVRMRRFKGAPSEVVMMPYSGPEKIGTDITVWCGVTKYCKPIPANLSGEALGSFPSFIPKTDEPNYQNCEGQEGIERLVRHPYYVTEKADGSSTTAYKYKGHFGVCSRNWELKRNENNGYWKIAIQHGLENKLPEGLAIQWETCGPNIQSNPMGFTDIIGLAFSAYNIEEKRYLTFDEFVNFCTKIKFPMVKILMMDDCFYKDDIETLGEGVYDNGNQREGVVVRSTENLFGHKPVSFKVINLNYDV